MDELYAKVKRIRDIQEELSLMKTQKVGFESKRAQLVEELKDLRAWIDKDIEDVLSN